MELILKHMLRSTKEEIERHANEISFNLTRITFTYRINFVCLLLPTVVKYLIENLVARACVCEFSFNVFSAHSLDRRVRKKMHVSWCSRPLFLVM